MELRRYPAYITASVTVDAAGYDQAANAGFNALGGYIFGNNVARGSISMTAPVTSSRAPGEKIAMTVPVTSERAQNEELQSATPICTVSCAGEYVVRFTMPRQYGSIDDLPAPTDRRVVLEEVPEHLAVAVAFSGRLDDRATATAVEQLEEWAEAEGWVVTGEPEAAQYDAPWKPGFIRHNEVIIPVSAD
jgi:hypothetical protein